MQAELHLYFVNRCLSYRQKGCRCVQLQRRSATGMPEHWSGSLHALTASTGERFSLWRYTLGCADSVNMAMTQFTMSSR